MNIQAETIQGKLQISILGQRETPQEIEVLKNILNRAKENGASSIILTFFDAYVVSLQLVTVLTDFFTERKEIPFKVFTLNSNLSFYLLKLGIKANHARSKSLYLSEYKDVKAVAIGGSADSLKIIFLIMKSVPLADISFFVIQHVPEDKKNMLEEVLQRHTCYKVITPKNGDLVRGGRLYVAPEGSHMKVSNNIIELTKETPVQHARPSISVFFSSLAKNYGEKAIAIVLSGYGSDGKDSLSLLKKMGTTVLIVDPQECEARQMPENCISTGNFDHIFSIQEIIRHLDFVLERYKISDEELDKFLRGIKKKYGYDYLDYEIKSIKRRIKVEMTHDHTKSFNHYSASVLTDLNMFEDLFIRFSIPHTDFFRNPETFMILKNEILPQLESFPSIRIWSAGCATGEETYSLAILLHEAGLLEKTQIYATDINPYVLQEAKNGLYSKRKISKYSENYNAAGGDKEFREYIYEGEGFFKMQNFLKKQILFFEHSLVGSGVLNEFQLILCRNVLIYFQSQLQASVLRLFHDSIDMSGYVVLGDKEYIIFNSGKNFFLPFNKKHRIFTKRDDSPNLIP